ncbi:methyltransferase domain protein [Mycobacterium xenopi 4042]|uniref:Methyltransferase domain protein n=1 Tax=Mycobacterium xenopi 4042 TaxID=1299334 RepID=X8AM60_MYCXE|nr:methyltransferase domain protein [Mycobacterium xenopi 4042]
MGAVPETLGQVDARTVAFLHLDMNCAAPEVDALRFFGRDSPLELLSCWTTTPSAEPTNNAVLWIAWHANWAFRSAHCPRARAYLSNRHDKSRNLGVADHFASGC